MSCRATSRWISCAFSLVLALCTAGPAMMPSQPPKSLLDRKVLPGASPTGDSFESFTWGLVSAGVPGGIASAVRCYKKPPAVHLSPETSNLRGVLAGVKASLPSSSFLVGARSIVMLAQGSVPALLRTRLGPFEIRDASLVAALELVVTRPEVRNAADRLGLVRTGFGGSSAYWPGVGAHPKPPPAITDFRFPGGTFLQALDALAIAGGHAVWEYSEARCMGHATFQLSWTVK